VQRSLARKLIALLLLLALIAGGGRFAAMAMDMDGAQMTHMQKPDMSCKACGGAMMAASCDAACTALPAIDVAVLGLSDVRIYDHWMTRSDSGATCSIRPDTSPPRA
jgi:hypothetical protein